MPAPAYNGYALTHHFRRLRQRLGFTHLQGYLYYELVAICNDQEWPAEFSISNTLLRGAVGCSEKGLIDARQALVEAGLIRYVEGKNGRPSAYRFHLGKGLPEVRDTPAEPLPQVRDAPAKPLPECLPEVSNPGAEPLLDYLPQVRVSDAKPLPEYLPEYLPQVSPLLYKEKTKTKTPGELAHTHQLGSAASLPFAPFWEAYDKKVGKNAALKKWQSLTPAEQAAILAHVPRYVAATPEKQFRKDPASYLHQRTWEDEELPPPRSGPRPAPAVPVSDALAARPVAPCNEEFEAERAAREEAAINAHFAQHAVPA